MVKKRKKEKKTNFKQLMVEVLPAQTEARISSQLGWWSGTNSIKQSILILHYAHVLEFWAFAVKKPQIFQNSSLQNILIHSQ